MQSDGIMNNIAGYIHNELKCQPTPHTREYTAYENSRETENKILVDTDTN